MTKEEIKKIKMDTPKGKVFIGGKSIIISNDAVPSKPPQKKVSKKGMSKVLKTISEMKLFIEPLGGEDAQ
ncbi:hypothetical protein KBG31_02645 [Patescibacteria group bacterium]|nr:hypothetical protein [Patescibacteria group bacterium]